MGPCARGRTFRVSKSVRLQRCSRSFVSASPAFGVRTARSLHDTSSDTNPHCIELNADCSSRKLFVASPMLPTSKRVSVGLSLTALNSAAPASSPTGLSRNENDRSVRLVLANAVASASAPSACMELSVRSSSVSTDAGTESTACKRFAPASLILL